MVIFITLSYFTKPVLSGSTELIVTVEPSDTTSEVVVPSGIMVGKAVVVPPVLSSSGEGLQLEISPDKAKISKANVAWIFILFKLNTGQIYKVGKTYTCVSGLLIQFVIF